MKTISMEVPYRKHYEAGVAAARENPNPVNPYTGPQYAGAKGQKKHAAWQAGAASVCNQKRSKQQ